MTPSPRWTDDALVELLEMLRLAGLSVGVAEHLKVRQIAGFVRAQGLGADPVRLRRHLGPVVVKSAEEQALFEGIFNDWWLALGGLADEVDAPQPAPPLEERPLGAAAQRAPASRYIGAAVAIAAALLLAIVWLRPEPEPIELRDMTAPDAALDAAPPSDAAVALADRGESGARDASAPEAGVRDASVRDAGARDAGVRDAGVRDAGVRDAEVQDGAPPSTAPDRRPTVRLVTHTGLPVADARLGPADALQLAGPPGAVDQIALRPDGSAVAVASRTGDLRIWSTDSGLARRLEDPPAEVVELTWSARGDHLAARGADGQARVWAMGRPSPIHRLDAVCALAFDAPGERLAVLSTATAQTRLHVAPIDGFDLAAAPTYAYPEGSAETCALAFSNSGAQIAAAVGSRIRLHDLAEAKAPPELVREAPVETIAFMNRGKELLLTDVRGKVSRQGIVGLFLRGMDLPDVSNWNDEDALVATLTRPGAAHRSPDGWSILTVDSTGAQVSRLARKVAANPAVRQAFWVSNTQIVAELSSGQICLGSRELIFDSPCASRHGRWAVRGEWLAQAGEDGVVRLQPLRSLELKADASAARPQRSVPATGQPLDADDLSDALLLSVRDPRFHTAWIDAAAARERRGTLVTLFPAPDRFARLLVHWRLITAGLGLLLLSLTVGWLLWRRRRRALILERRPAAADQSITSIDLPEPERGLYTDAAFGRLRTALRRRVAQGAQQLDADRTVAATLDNHGWFTPIYRQHRVAPVYLALIHREGARDQGARRVDALLDRLQAGGVDVVRYSYRSDPRRCRPDRGPSARRDLVELAGLYPGHRLLVFGEADHVCDPVTGRPVPWLGQLAAWPERALMAARPPAEWGREEAALVAAGLTVLPSTQAGLASFVALVDAATAQPAPDVGGAPWTDELPERWLSRHPPDTAEVDALIRRLRATLDEDGVRWLQALAAHPELHWQLTIFLGLRLAPGAAGPVFDEARLIRLTHLPWLRAGWMPDWLRTRLLADMAPADALGVRAFLQDLLEHQSDRHSAFRLDLARPDAAQSRRAWRRLIVDILRTEPAGSPLTDRLFVDFLVGKRPGALQVAAPGRWRRWVWSNGLRSLGLRPLGAIAGCAVLLAGTAGLGWGLRALEAKHRQPPGFHVSPLITAALDPAQVLQQQTIEGIRAVGFCAGGWGDVQIVAQGSAPPHCGARFESDAVDDPRLGALASDPLLIGAGPIRVAEGAGRAVSTVGRFAHLWALDSGAIVASFEHPGATEDAARIVSVDLSRDGGRIVTASRSQVVEWLVSEPPPEERFDRIDPGATIGEPAEVLVEDERASTRECLSACLVQPRCAAVTWTAPATCRLFSRYTEVPGPGAQSGAAFIRWPSPGPDRIARFAQLLSVATLQMPVELTVRGQTYQYTGREFGVVAPADQVLRAPRGVSYPLAAGQTRLTPEVLAGTALALAEVPVPIVWDRAEARLRFPTNAQFAEALRGLEGWTVVESLDHHDPDSPTRPLLGDAQNREITALLRRAREGDVLITVLAGPPTAESVNIEIVIEPAAPSDPEAAVLSAYATGAGAITRRRGLKWFGGVILRYWLLRYGSNTDCDPWMRNACDECGPVPAETCDGTDNDCDGETDEGVKNACGGCGPAPVEICDGKDNDCDDKTDEGVLNACGGCGAVAAEICDGIDNDCDGTIDEGVKNACGRCGAVPAEVCNERDDDCDGRTDEGVTVTVFRDADRDGFGDPRSPAQRCGPGGGFVDRAKALDCNDANADVNPRQTGFFERPHDGRSFDWNCDGRDEKRFTYRAEVCRCGGFMMGRSLAEGYYQPIPACGTSGKWVSDCKYQAGRATCEWDRTVSRVQACR